jgi:hypothetical protein
VLRRKSQASEGEDKIRPSSEIRTLICTACGAEARRGNAKFCLTCGKILREEYQPLDALRSSYRMQGKSFRIEAGAMETNLFEKNENQASQAAWACLVYSFVPYLGILFVPITVFAGGLGCFVSYRRPHLGGRKLGLACIALSFVVLAVQIMLWKLLYIIPELGKGI